MKPLYLLKIMANKQFEELAHLIKTRRSIGWAKMNGTTLPNETVEQILALADWAPTHGRTEPWRFFVCSGQAMADFSKAHADLYWQNTPEDKRLAPTYERLLHCTDKASHLVIAAMKRGINPNIPAIEEYLQLTEEDQVLGMIFLGYTDEPVKEGTRTIPMTEKIKWL